MEFTETLMARRSIRKFTSEPVSDEQVELVLRAAMAAPSAGNEQPWRFVVVRDRATLDALSVATPYARPLASAPVGIVVCADMTVLRYTGFWVLDCAAAIENMLLAATSLGLGSLWMGVYPEERLVEPVGLVMPTPDDIVVHSMVALGHAESIPQAPDRFEPAYVHHESW